MRYCQLIRLFGAAATHDIISLNGQDAGLRQLRLAPGAASPRLHCPPRAKTMAASLHQAAGLLRRLAPDLVLTSNWGSIEWAMAARGLGLAHVHAEDGFGPEEVAGQLPRRVWTRRLVLRRSQVILPSATLLALARDTWRLPAGRLHHIANGIDLAAAASAAPLALGLAGPVIGTIAALRPEKNLIRLLDAHALVRRARAAAGLAAPHLVIAGDGPERPRLQAHAEALGLAAHVMFTGYTTAAAQLHQAFDVLALSSDTEQMPLAVLEAMGAAKPVAATDVGDVRAMLAPANAPFVVARDAAALAGAILALLADPDAARAIGAANRAHAEALYDERAMAASWARHLGVAYTPA